MSWDLLCIEHATHVVWALGWNIFYYDLTPMWVRQKPKFRQGFSLLLYSTSASELVDVSRTSGFSMVCRVAWCIERLASCACRGAHHVPGRRKISLSRYLLFTKSSMKSW